jgi:hypothetical protein
VEPLGIHVAIAAWIDQNRTYEGFAAVPANPIRLTPSSILPLSQSLDEFQQAELVRMANLVPKKGKIAEPFGPSAPLWEVVSEVIDRMDFARKALTDSEADALESGRRVLYVDGTGDSTPHFNAYLLMQTVVQTLQQSGAAAEVQQAALSDWLTLGFKNEIEQALAVVIRLAAKSSVTEAMSCRAQLDETMLLSAGDITYAPTSFYPMSAAVVGTWTLAEVSLEELSSCVARMFPASPVSFASASAAKCRFGFVAIETLRPWPFAQLLAGDDWKLSTGEPVSFGDGARGTLPAYVQTLYAASVIGVSATPVPLPQVPTIPWEASLRRARVPVIEPVIRRSEKPGDTSLRSDEAGGVIAGQLAGRNLAPMAPVGTVLRPRDMALVRRFQIRLDRQEWLARLVDLQPDRPLHPDEPTGEPAPIDLAGGARIVGFGCVVVPSCPQPNEQYQW